MSKPLVALTLLLASLAYADGPAAPNVTPITIGGDTGSINNPEVAVTICSPGTSKCTNIPHLQLDTGSTGLRIFKSAVTVPLKPVATGVDGAKVATCVPWAGAGFWGPVELADVVVGSLKARNVRIQVVDADYGPPPSECAPVDQRDPDSYNGILGIGPEAIDCDDGACDWPSYYSCGADGCKVEPIEQSLKLQNVLAFLPSDNNGYSVSLPSVPKDGTHEITGALTLGIGTRDNNRPPQDVTVIKTDENGNFKVKGADSGQGSGFLPALIDSGTYALHRPWLAVPSCPADSLVYGLVLCPKGPIEVPLELADSSGASVGDVSVEVSNGTALMAPGKIVLPDLAFRTEPEDDQTVLRGVPFFLGRTVYLGLDGKKSALGTGPLVGFTGTH